MTTRARLTVYAALATMLAALSMKPLLHPAGWLFTAAVLVLVVALAGAALRRLALARPLVVIIQLMAVLWLVLQLSVPSRMSFGVLPGPPAIHAATTLLNQVGEDIQQYAIPAPATGSLKLLLLGSVSLIAIAVDALAVTYRRAALAGLPLLALYSVGSSLAGDNGTPWLWFLLTATGYLMLLFAEGRDRLSRWGRVFRGAGTPSSGGSSAPALGGQRIGVLALGAALLLGFLPYPDLSLVSGGFGAAGSGGHGGNINALNPVVSLADGLRRPQNQDLIRYQSSNPDLAGSYLRITALDQFDGQDWTPSPQAVEQVPNGSLPDPEGLSGQVSLSSLDVQVQVNDKLATEWLPAPYPLAKANPPGRWRYEPQTRSVIGDKGQKVTGLSYSVTSLDLKPTADQLRAAGQPSPTISGRDLQVPANLPAVVKNTALSVTEGQTTAYDQAVALQDWFTRPGNFTYSPAVDAGTGPEAIAKFLADKQGFCVHFAATMAAMARTLGIPARVAVGFAPGRSLGQNTYEVGTQDYHAWPELYFEGYGWMRFEPTPHRGTPPSYTSNVAAPVPTATATQPTGAASTEPSAAPAASSSCAGPKHQLVDCASEQAAAPTATAKESVWVSPQVLALLSAAGAVLLLLLAPMIWRARLRRRRLGSGRRRTGSRPAELTQAQVLAAWEELIDSAWDLGIAPDEARSPRHTVARLTEAGELGAEAQAAVGRVALATERALYARDAGQPTPLGPDVRIVREGLRASAGRRRRLRAVLLPPSTARLLWRAGDRMQALRERGRAAVARLTGALPGVLTRALRRSGRRSRKRWAGSPRTARPLLLLAAC